MRNFETFGEILEKEFIVPHYSNYANFAKSSGLPIKTIEKLCKGEQGVPQKLLSLFHIAFITRLAFGLAYKRPSIKNVLIE